MEEFLRILFTVVILALVVVSNRKKRSQSAAQPEYEPAERTFPQVRPQRIVPNVGHAQRTGRRQGSAPGGNVREEVATPQVHATHTAPGDHPASPAVMEDFDLRKAVIWSEVLRPKFEEE